MNAESQRLKDALDSLDAAIAKGEATVPAIQARIDAGVDPAEVGALADQVKAAADKAGPFVDSLVALTGTATSTV